MRIFHKQQISDGCNHPKISPIRKILSTRGSTVNVQSDLETGSTGYERQAGSWYASTKSAEIGYLAACVVIICTKINVNGQWLLDSC